MEDAHYDRLWSECIPTDILGSISSRLLASEYFVFRAVCKKWRSAPLTPPPPPPSMQDDSSSPYLMTLREEIGIVEFFHPVYNALTIHKTGILKLRGSRIRSSRSNWLLMSHVNHAMFFFNPISNDIIELPDLPQRNACSAWTFSCPPDSSSSDCFVVGFETLGNFPKVCIIKIGDTEWTYHDFYNNRRKFIATGCNNPLFFENNIVYVLGNKGDLGTLSIKENSVAETPTWEFYGRHFPCSKQKLIRKVYTAEDVDNGGMLAVFLSREEGDIEVWRYKVNGRMLEREQITSLDSKTLFVSYGGCYLKSCVAPGLGNKIYFPMFHDNNKGVFYCLADHKYYSFNYFAIKAYSSPNIFNLIQPIPCIWIEPEND